MKKISIDINPEGSPEQESVLQCLLKSVPNNKSKIQTIKIILLKS